MSVNAALYVRQSVKKDEGIDRQLRRTRIEAERRGWSVVAEFQDNDTSATKARGAKTAWAQLLKGAAARDFTHVLSVDLDRLLRTQRDLLTLIDAGLSVTTLDGEIDLSTADGEFRASMGVALARFEAARKSERSKRANLDRAARGLPNPGKRRFGFETDGLTLRESEATEVRAMFADILAGGSIRSNATRTNRPPIRVREILTNPFYAGRSKHLGVVTDSAVIPQVVSRADFDAVQAILENPARKTSPGNSPKHVGSGTTFCGVCGAPLVFMRSYRCSASSAHVSILKDTLDPAIALGVYEWLHEHMEETETGSPKLGALSKELAEVNRKRGVAQALALMDGADLSQVRGTLAALGREADALNTAITVERAGLAQNGLRDELRRTWYEAAGAPSYETLVDSMAEWLEFWKGLEIDRKREVVRSTLRVVVNKGRSAERIVITELD